MSDAQFRWTSAARSDVGLVRSRNEDAVLELPARGLWAVADGMGGHACGDVASRTVVDSLAAIAAAANLEQYVAGACSRLRLVNQQLRTEALTRKVSVIGSTVVALLACGGEAGFLWAGDSRLYLCRNGRLQQLTRDHSQAEEMKSFGPALGHAAPSGITRAVGAADTIELEQRTLALRDGDMFLLCSDGLSNPVDETHIARALQAGDCKLAVDALISLALANGGRDNVSVVVAKAELAFGEKTVLNPAL
jgi:protein phosphatase